MGSKIGELCVFNESIHNQVDKIKIVGAWGFIAPGLSLQS
jgi:hypothetical protein